jgi:PEGA domain
MTTARWPLWALGAAWMATAAAPRAAAGQPPAAATKPAATAKPAANPKKPAANRKPAANPKPAGNPNTPAADSKGEPATRAPVDSRGTDDVRRAGPRARDDAHAPGTEEVDRCRPRQGLTEQQHIEHAADHYDRGLVLYEQGDYQAAVAEFVVAYCDKPHPKMFLNIGQAYERMLNFEKAVAYFERFIRESDDREPNRKRAAIRVEVLRGLPARIIVATVPPGAEVTLSGQTGITARARANGVDPIEVRKGVYTMRVEMSGHEPVVQRVVAEIGQPYSYYFRLEPKKGAVRVVATPPESRIFINDRLVGIGSYLETIPIGRYRLLVEAEGRPTQRRPIEVTAGRTTDVAINLPQKPNSGRWELILASGLVLGSAAGAMADTLFDQDSLASSLIGVGGLGVGFGAAFLGVPKDVTVGTSSYLIGSTLIGAMEGAMVSSMFAGDDCFDEGGGTEDDMEEQRDCNDDLVGGVTLATGTAGLLFASLTVTRFDLDAGDAALINSGAMWGTGSAALFWASFDTDDEVLEPMILAGLNLGVVAGAVLGRGAEVTRGRVALIDLSGLGGTVGGFALGQAIDTNNERRAHFALVGMATGLIAGTWLTRNLDAPKVNIQPGVSPSASGEGAVATLAMPF